MTIGRSLVLAGLGVPVLYQRPGDLIVLPAVTDPTVRDQLAETAGTFVNHRIREVGAKGKYRAVTAGVMAAGLIEAHLKVGRFSGTGTQVEVENCRAAASRPTPTSTCSRATHWRQVGQRRRSQERR